MQRCYVIPRSEDWQSSLPLEFDSLGVIKYRGKLPIEGWDDVYGIEWDRRKGKNSGLYREKKIFDCLPNRGSFVKNGASFQIIKETDGIDFKSAWNIRYGKSDWRLQKNALTEANLSGYAISKMGGCMDEFSTLRKLNLSFNLLSRWDEDLTDGLKCLESLQSLNLSGNRFLNIENVSQEGTEIDSLLLASCLFQYTDRWWNIVSWFKNIRRLNLGFNEFDDGQFENLTSLECTTAIEVLELNCNCFEKLEFCDQNWGSLKLLELSSCPIEQISICLSSLETLDISNTRLCSSVEKLDTLLTSLKVPKLRAIKLLTNDAIQSLDYRTNRIKLNDTEEVDYDFVLGLVFTKLPQLEQINGTRYTGEEIEKYKSNYSATFSINHRTARVDPSAEHITITVKMAQKNGGYAEEKLQVKRGTPWYAIHGLMVKQYGLTPGQFKLIP